MNNPVALEDTMPALIFAMLKCPICQVRLAAFRRDEQCYYYDARYVQSSNPLWVVACDDPLICPAPHEDLTRMELIGSAVMTSDGRWIMLDGEVARGYG